MTHAQAVAMGACEHVVSALQEYERGPREANPYADTTEAVCAQCGRAYELRYPTTAVILTTYNRPTLVVDAIESVCEQLPLALPWRLYIMDDGCDEESRNAIATALQRAKRGFAVFAEHASYRGWWEWFPNPQIIWWQGRDRSMPERKATIPYSYTINIALNSLLHPDDQQIAFLCDDDHLYPESLESRARYLLTHPEANVVYGHSRSVQFDNGGFNQWKDAAPPKAGRCYPRPSGRREVRGHSAYIYFDGNERDPETGLDYVEEAVWTAEPFYYGQPYRTDHNQVMIRRTVLESDAFPRHPRGRSPEDREWWGEDKSRWSVGDEAFFTMISRHPFHAVDAWACVKKFSAASDGVSFSERRE